MTEGGETEAITYPIRSDKLSMTVKVSRTVVSHRSRFQRIDIVETGVFGRMLLLDGHIQLTEFDERAYHESLALVPLLSIPEPRRALVVGGGDGGVIRELCRDPGIERIDLVEIDEDVVSLCRRHLPTLNNGAFEDPRVHLHIADAFRFVQDDHGPYDLIVADSTDVYEDEEGGLSAPLFTERFYADLRRLLTPNGFVVTQADNPVFCPYSLEAVSESFQRVYPASGRYQAMVPSFGGLSAFVWGSGGSLVPPELPRQARRLGRTAYLDEASWRFAMDSRAWPLRLV